MHGTEYFKMNYFNFKISFRSEQVSGNKSHVFLANVRYVKAHYRLIAPMFDFYSTPTCFGYIL